MNDLTLFSPYLEQKKGMTEVRCYGIDLGTTNSTVAEAFWTYNEDPVCRALEIDQSLWPAGIMTSTLVPSVIALLDSEEPMVGEGAKRLRTRPQEANLFLEKNLFYETKNDMGLRKTYHRASESFNHASKIAGHILRFLKDSSIQGSKGNPARFCVTVPASFQLNQRRDTLHD